ncbi:winged helix-turn-helix domain-containing protein [Streptomyces murinus]|uniref:winged helix-turn-helix domain-containing protein n=1 Tax=Streptomyces murinus TaxID=33900 RepID=UPI0037F15DF1
MNSRKSLPRSEQRSQRRHETRTRDTEATVLTRATPSTPSARSHRPLLTSRDPMPIRAGTEAPPYQQAASILRAEITVGRFKPGQRLPAYRELQERFGIANMTARSAIAVLRSEGLVHTVQGLGTFVRDTASPLPASPSAPDADLHDLVLGLTRQIEYLTQRVTALESDSHRATAPPSVA